MGDHRQHPVLKAQGGFELNTLPVVPDPLKDHHHGHGQDKKLEGQLGKIVAGNGSGTVGQEDVIHQGENKEAKRYEENPVEQSSF